eukprot:3681276-Ditylum_brightwellii.AAC.1
MFFCNFCKECWFLKKSGKSNPGESDMDPYQDGFPHHLPKLFKIKEMLIDCVYPVMKTYRLKGGTIGYK